MAFYARPRYAKDSDILVDPTVENSKKIVSALNEFGFRSLGLSEEDFAHEGKFIQLGYEPIRIDVITSIQGLDFQDIWVNRRKGNYGGHEVYFIGLDEFIKSKEIANRKQDIADLEKLSPLMRGKKRKNK